MTMHGKRNSAGALALAAILAFATTGEALGQRSGAHPAPGAAAGGAHQHFDSRFSHNRYYYDRGYSVRRPPAGGFGELHDRDGGRYWYRGGNWYRWRGGAWIVWGAPIGLFVPLLPPYFTTVWWHGAPYYYANETYYVWDDEQHEYQVVAAPDGIDAGGTTRAPASDRLFIYPKSGQSSEQQGKDRYECHRWAAGQSGFDPTVAGGGVAPEKAVSQRNEYFRAQVACLEGRGYTVE